MTMENPASESSVKLPLLYFERRGGTLFVNVDDNNNNNSTCSKRSNSTKMIEFPIEIVQQFLTSYATWGDLAKLASVQKQWAGIISDAANTSASAKWSLAQSLLHGTNGLHRNPIKALQLLKELSNTANNNVDDNDDDSNNNTILTEQKFVIPAMKQIAKLYLTGSSVVSEDDVYDNNTSTFEKSDAVSSSSSGSDDNDIVPTVQQDTTVGLEWLVKCHVLAGDSNAAHDLALIYEYGQYGVPIDVVAAVEWFTKAAEGGHIEAMAELGLCYELGCGVEQSDSIALDWYMKAAELGHNTAKYSIGEAFEEARGVPQSDEEACIWYYRAAIEGCVDSRRALKRLEDIARIVVPGFRSLILDV